MPKSRIAAILCSHADKALSSTSPSHNTKAIQAAAYNQFGWWQAAAIEASKQACNNNDSAADNFLSSSTWPFLAAAQTAEARMNAGSEALLIGDTVQESGQLLTFALRQRCAE